MFRTRSPIAVLVVAIALGLLTALFVQSQLASVGATQEVTVAARAVPAGRVLSADDVRRHRVPVAALPASELPTANPVGRTTTVDLAPGEVLQVRRLGAGGTAALVPEGQVAMGLIRPEGTPVLATGQRVDVLSRDQVVASDVRVVAVQDESVVVAVPAATAPAISRALSERNVLVVVRGTGPRAPG